MYSTQSKKLALKNFPVDSLPVHLLHWPMGAININEPICLPDTFATTAIDFASEG